MAHLDLTSYEANAAFVDYHEAIEDADRNYMLRPDDLAIDAAIQSRTARIIEARASLLAALGVSE